MGKKLYVGNISFNVDDATLSETFSQCGTVDSARIIMDRHTGRSKGFGFVEMSTDQEASEAISKFDGADWEGRTLKVNEARPQEPRSGGYDGGRDRGRF